MSEISDNRILVLAILQTTNHWNIQCPKMMIFQALDASIYVDMKPAFGATLKAKQEVASLWNERAEMEPLVLKKAIRYSDDALDIVARIGLLIVQKT